MKVYKTLNKKLTFLAVFILISILFSSCEKCMRCSYYYKENYNDTRYLKYEAEECGKEEDINQFFESMEYAASQFDTIPACVSW